MNDGSRTSNTHRDLSVLARLTGSFLAGTHSDRTGGRHVGIEQAVTSPEEARLWTLEEIGRLISQSGNASETLTNIVHLIQRRFETDVCSVYLLEPDRANLVLAATTGLL